MDVVFEVRAYILPSLQKKKCVDAQLASTTTTPSFFQTAMYLSPKDLLQLSRLSKQFRSIFASRSALFIWQTVLRNADLKCFEDLNEMQFASLLYDKCCMVNFSVLFFFVPHVRVNHYTYMIYLFILHFRHADVSRGDAGYSPCFV